MLHHKCECPTRWLKDDRSSTCLQGGTALIYSAYIWVDTNVCLCVWGGALTNRFSSDTCWASCYIHCKSLGIKFSAKWTWLRRQLYCFRNATNRCQPATITHKSNPLGKLCHSAECPQWRYCIWLAWAIGQGNLPLLPCEVSSRPGGHTVDRQSERQVGRKRVSRQAGRKTQTGW